MPFLKGQSLDDVLKTRNTLSNEQVIRLGIQVAQGLAAAHERGLIHRDIKPLNVMVGELGEVQVMDWGLAKELTSRDRQGAGDETNAAPLPGGRGSLEQTAAGTVMGTPSYMAPEQARGLKVDGRADLYSLGVVLYRAATGQLPINGENTMSMLMALATETPRPANEVNPEVLAELSAFIMRLLAKDPDQRPASAQAVMRELQALQKEPVDTSAPMQLLPRGRGSEKTTRGRGPGWRRRWPLVAAALLLAFVPLGYFFGGTIIRIATNQGELVVEVDDPGVEIKVVQNGVVVQDKTAQREFTLTAGKGQIEVFEKDGIKLATRQFELTRGANTTVKVMLQELADARTPKTTPPLPPGEGPGVRAPSGDPDRKAAEYVLSIGGQVQVNYQNDWLWINTDTLPKKPFSLTAVQLANNQKLTDAGLAHFKDCKGLTHLSLWNTQVTDAGLAHLKDCRRLERLHLGSTKVTDTGLANFIDCKRLMELDLMSTPVTDAGLAHFKDCNYLGSLVLANTAVTDAGLAHFKDCKGMGYLHLGNLKRVTDAGLAHFKDCKKLFALYLNGTLTTDAGLAHFKDCKHLQELNLHRTPVTDAGLAHFRDCKGLTLLNLHGTQVTDAGLAHFRNCAVLTHLEVGNTQLTDAGIQHLEGLTKLETLDLRQTKVTAVGIDRLQKALPKCKIEWDGAKK
jgi:uncharacterized membrane protein